MCLHGGEIRGLDDDCRASTSIKLPRPVKLVLVSKASTRKCRGKFTWPQRRSGSALWQTPFIDFDSRRRLALTYRKTAIKKKVARNLRVGGSNRSARATRREHCSFDDTSVPWPVSVILMCQKSVRCLGDPFYFCPDNSTGSRLIDSFVDESANWFGMDERQSFDCF